MSECLQDAIQQTIPRSLKRPMIVSVSGGVDSMVLLHVLHSMDFPLVVAHVNHQKRKASVKEYEAIMQYCDTIGVPFEGTRYKDGSGNFQADARNFRLAFLKDKARQYNAKYILTAHHQDDRIETFMMRLSEGRSLNALTSIRTVSETEGLTFVKPFLSIRKDTLRKYAQEHEIPYFEDASNQELIYTRNVVRHKLLPRFNELNPSFDETVVQLIDELQEADEFIEKTVIARPAFKKDTVILSDFLSLSPLLQRRFLKRKIQTYIPSYHPSKKELSTIIQTINRPSNAEIPLKDGFSLHKEYQIFFIKKHDDAWVFSLKITGPGLYSLPGGSTLEITTEKKVRNVTKVYELWYNDFVYPLYLRHRKDGDRIRFSYGHKKIKDLFIDLKIPPHKRNKILLLTDDKNNVLWIPSLDIQSFQDKGRNRLLLYFHENQDLT
ncbi:MAG: tRNA lysidine(34) synthetase TilS [Bacillota bacterium]